MPTYPDCSCAWKVQDPACPYHGTGAKPAGPAPYPPDDIPHHVNEHFAAKVTERDNSIYDDAAEYLAERDALLDAAYRRGLEDAAKVCEALAEGRWATQSTFPDERYAARECAAAIRASQPTTPA